MMNSSCPRCWYFYPRSPCGERRMCASALVICTALFLSTLSLRRATVDLERLAAARAISIHALLAESDKSRPCRVACCAARFLSTLSLRRATCYRGACWSRFRNFYPRSPCGERQVGGGDNAGVPVISIHALLAESDRNPLLDHRADPDFYPRSPCGERQQKCTKQ